MWKYHVLPMQNGWIPNKNLTHNPRRRRNIGRSQDGGKSILLRRAEQTTHGLIHEDEDDDEDDD
jgi:hypothetical protein